MRNLILMALYVVLVAYCVTDVRNHPDRQPFGLHKFAWILLIVLLPYLGAAAWIIVKLRAGGTGPRPTGPGAPDDDPEYLNWVAQQQRRRREQGDNR